MVIKLPIFDWSSPINSELCATAIDELEAGKILLLEQLPFTLSTEEHQFLIPDCLEKGRKNVSYDFNNDTIKGIHSQLIQETLSFKSMMRRYAIMTQRLLAQLFPTYQSAWTVGRTSFRPIEIASRTPLSKLKDDRLLHVDAFPTTPVGENRILRFFTNINPDHLPRRWRLGQAFSDVAAKFIPHIPQPWIGVRKLKQWLHITRGYQTLYDYYMLSLHNAMKNDSSYQKGLETIYDFPAGTSWLTYTDVVSHAAIAGQFVMEQTFYIPVTAMQTPARSPLRMLETKLAMSLI